jgi:DNA-directed RNA polymerase specialized sigma24 family protein
VSIGLPSRVRTSDRSVVGVVQPPLTECRRRCTVPLDMPAPKKPTEGAPEAKDDTDEFLEWLEGVPDPQERYRRATAELEKHQQVVERLSSVRANAASDAYESGDTVRALAEQLGVSPSRVHQLIQESKARTSKGAGAKRRPSSRQKGRST